MEDQQVQIKITSVGMSVTACETARAVVQAAESNP
jgi:hypothetical protein